MKFTAYELTRYARHLSLQGFGPEGQQKLRRGRVLVIGAGGLGCPALLYLAAAGVGRIELMDADTVDTSNLQRQVLYTTEDAGHPKAEAAARRLRALNPLIEVVPRVERFTRENALQRLAECDLVIDGSDNFATRYLVNDACVLADRPFVYGAIQGFEGQVSVFNWRGGPTYRCIFPEPPEPGTVLNCAQAGVLGVLPGLIGTMQATEAIKLLSGIGDPLSGKLLLWNALTMSARVVRFSPTPGSRSIPDLPAEGYGTSCGTGRTASPSGDEISVPELVRGLSSVQLLDVREGWERESGAITPSVHLPLGALARKDSAPALDNLDRAKPLVVYCAGGVRSLKAIPVLRSLGFANARSLQGGYAAWCRK